MERKDYLKLIGGSALGAVLTTRKAFATEPSNGVFNYDDKVIIDGNQIEKNKADIATNAEDIAANALHIGNVDDFKTIFTGEEDKPENCVDAIEKILKEMGKRANVEDVHPHRFRRTLATNLLSKGMAIEEVKTILGHEKLDTTMIYCNINQESVKHNYTKLINS